MKRVKLPKGVGVNSRLFHVLFLVFLGVVLFFVVMSLVGCVTGERVADLDRQLQENVSQIDGFQDRITELQNRITDSMTDAESAAIDSSVTRLQDAIDTLQAENADIATRIETLLDPDTTASEGLGTGIQLVGSILGGPWGIGLTALGGLLIGDRNRKRVESHEFGSLVKSIDRTATSDGNGNFIIPKELLGTVQDAAGIRERVRRARG